MDKHVAVGEPTDTPREDAVEALRQRLGTLDPCQVAAWRAMNPARRLVKQGKLEMVGRGRAAYYQSVASTPKGDV